MKYYKSPIKLENRQSICLLQFVLFEFWMDGHSADPVVSGASLSTVAMEITKLIILRVGKAFRIAFVFTTSIVASGSRQRSFHLFCQINPTVFRVTLKLKRTTQILMKYAG